MFCGKCSSKSCPLPKFGIEKEVSSRQSMGLKLFLSTRSLRLLAKRAARPICPPYPLSIEIYDVIVVLVTSDYAGKFKRTSPGCLQAPDRRDLGVLAGAANGVGGGVRPSWGGPRTQMGQGKPLVSIFSHAFKIVTPNLSPFQ